MKDNPLQTEAIQFTMRFLKKVLENKRRLPTGDKGNNCH